MSYVALRWVFVELTELLFGVTETGRHLLVVLDEPTATGCAYVVTARSMTTRERCEYEEAQQ